MKYRILITLVLFIAAIAYSDNAKINGHPTTYSPGDISSIKLGTCNGSSEDSIEASAYNVYGPYNLSQGRTTPMYQYFKFYYSDSVVISATDSLALSYQITSGASITDTTASGWTLTDTVTGVSGGVSSTVDISSSVGSSIFFKLSNLQSADTAVVYNPIRCLFKESLDSYNIKR